jgi:protein-S-isoprenylcysteine O-methyltransferase Ste14
MLIEALHFTAFCAYLAAWFVFAVGAVASSVPLIQRQAGAAIRIKPAVAVGALLQIAAILTITFRLSGGPLRPKPFELVAVALLAPFAAAVFVWALLSASRRAGLHRLVTHGVYAWMRHPIYLALLAMLLATGLLASAGQRLLVAVVIYLTGSELRIASEEEDLARKFAAEYEQYRLRTRWRYLPGLR